MKKLGSGHRERALERRRLRRRGGARLPHRTVHSDVSKKMRTIVDNGKSSFQKHKLCNKQNLLLLVKNLLLLSRETKKFTTNQKALIRGGRLLVLTAAWGP